MFHPFGDDRQRLLLIVGLFFFFLFLLNEFYEERTHVRRDRLTLLRRASALVFRDVWIVAWALLTPFIVLSAAALMMAWTARVGAKLPFLLAIETAFIGLFTAAGFYVSASAIALAVMACAIKRLQGGRPGFSDGWGAVRVYAGPLWRGTARELGRLMSGRAAGAPLDGLSALLVLPVILAEGLGWEQAVARARLVRQRRFPEEGPAQDFMELAGVTFAISMLLAFFFTLLFVFLPDFFPAYFAGSHPLLDAARGPAQLIAPIAAGLFGCAVLAALFVMLALMAYVAAVYLYAEGGGTARRAVLLFFPAELLPEIPPDSPGPPSA